MEAYIMTVYMVERDLPGITLEQLGGALKSAIETSEKGQADTPYTEHLYPR
jgi:hypothetical protein